MASACHAMGSMKRHGLRSISLRDTAYDSVAAIHASTAQDGPLECPMPPAAVQSMTVLFLTFFPMARMAIRHPCAASIRQR
jgi:hypothetical protein